MPEPRALTGNAADPAQVRYAARKERQRAERFSRAMKVVLSSAEGRLVIGELLERSGLWRTSWDPSAKIHFNEGRRNFGLELLAEVQTTDEEAYLLMERERRAWHRSEAAETAASQTPSAAGGQQ